MIGQRSLRHERGVIRRELRVARASGLHRLHWHVPGTVWAMDHTFPRGRRGHPALCIRDLASGTVLHISLRPEESGRDVRMVLLSLLEEFGRPLVIKADNGAAFRGAAIRSLARTHRFVVLYSPPRRPAYNGACEVTCRWLKARADDLMLLFGADLNLALTLAARRVGAAPDDGSCWGQHEWGQGDGLIRRAAFMAQVRRHQRRLRAAAGIAEDLWLPHPVQAAMDRVAIRSALLRTGLLRIESLAVRESRGGSAPNLGCTP